jgi:hypothetical protein
MQHDTDAPVNPQWGKHSMTQQPTDYAYQHADKRWSTIIVKIRFPYRGQGCMAWRDSAKKRRESHYILPEPVPKHMGARGVTAPVEVTKDKRQGNSLCIRYERNFMTRFFFSGRSAKSIFVIGESRDKTRKYWFIFLLWRGWMNVHLFASLFQCEVHAHVLKKVIYLQKTRGNIHWKCATRYAIQNHDVF